MRWSWPPRFTRRWSWPERRTAATSATGRAVMAVPVGAVAMRRRAGSSTGLDLRPPAAAGRESLRRRCKSLRRRCTAGASGGAMRTGLKRFSEKDAKKIHFSPPTAGAHPELRVTPEFMGTTELQIPLPTSTMDTSMRRVSRTCTCTCGHNGETVTSAQPPHPRVRVSRIGTAPRACACLARESLPSSSFGRHSRRISTAPHTLANPGGGARGDPPLGALSRIASAREARA